jgi:hypothetical protein
MSLPASPHVLSRQPLFCLGQIFATPGAIDLLSRTDTDHERLLNCHQHGDWGAVNAQDARSNDRAVIYGTRILSAYELGNCRERLWVITEADRRGTTLLLPVEY